MLAGLLWTLLVVDLARGTVVAKESVAKGSAAASQSSLPDDSGLAQHCLAELVPWWVGRLS